MKKKLTVAEVKALQRPQSGEVFVWDTELNCFGVKLTPSRATYIVQCRVGTKTVKYAVGKVGEITLHEARIKAMKALAELRSGIDLNLQNATSRVKAVTLRQAYREFKESRSLKPRTIQTYDENINRCLPDWMDKPLSSITKDMVEKRHKQLSTKNGPRGKGEATANQAMRLLRVIFNFAAARYEDANGASLLPENPVKRLNQVRGWNKIQRRQDIIQPHELAAWYKGVNALKNPVMRDYFLFCLFTGLRRTEASKLKWSHVDLKSRILTVPAELTKTNTTHQLPLCPVHLTILARRGAVRRIDNEYIFPEESGIGHIVEPKRSVASVCKASGVKWSMHTLRRTFETTAEGLDISYYALKRLLNHRLSGDVTSGYIITSTKRLAEPMQKICDHLESCLHLQESLANE